MKALTRTCVGVGLALTLCLGCSQPQPRRGRRKKSKAAAATASARSRANQAVTEAPKAPLPAYNKLPGNSGNAYLDRCAELWNDLHNPGNGYFSPEGIPYHAPESLIVEAPAPELQESVWETIPQPSCENFRWGGRAGYLDLFVEQDGGYQPQWKYTNAPDADARAVQALYWAKVWADEKGGSPVIDELSKKGAKMGVFLRYAFFDKYFKKLGCTSPSCEAARDRESAHYLISWYYAWGGSLAKSGGWSWRIGSSTSHEGYQNPFAAYVLSQVAAFKAVSKTAVSDWNTSVSRQLEVLRWLQSSEGAIAGGVTNSWMGRYAQPPAGTPTFYRMAYVEKPGQDPPSNQWFGFQAWGLERSAALYWHTGDDKAKVILDRWVKWATSHVHLLADGGYEIPSTLQWSGQPASNWDTDHQNWNAADRKWNDTLHVKVLDYTQDVGITATFARTLLYYGAASGRHDISRMGQELLDRMWKLYRTSKVWRVPRCVAITSASMTRCTYPRGSRAKCPTAIRSKATPRSSRCAASTARMPIGPRCRRICAAGRRRSSSTTRFWAQADIALSNATFAWIFPNGIPNGKSAKPGTNSKAPPAKARAAR